MVMTIDNSIRILEDAQRWRKKYGIFGTEEDDAINKLIEVAKKYQQIQEIVKEWREVGLDYDSCDAMDNIERVIEDGKID